MEELYETIDLYFAAFINASGVDLHSTKKFTDRGKTKVKFIFELSEEEFDKFKSSFFGGSGTVKGLAYTNSIRSLKSLCFV